MKKEKRGCEFVIPLAKGARICDSPARHFLTSGEVGEVNVWLCLEHHKYCDRVLKWQLKSVTEVTP